VPDGAFEYIPRRPEKTVLYGVIAEELETFLADRRERERPLPQFVEREFRSISHVDPGTRVPARSL
jgi:hypothetical protein